MRGKKLLAGLLALSLLPFSAFSVLAAEESESLLQVPVEKELAKSELGNPFLGFDQNGNRLYGGDPSIMVDGDTVYAYVGNDTASGEGYWMPNWRCYSSTDMIHWEYESIILENRDIPWAANDHEAWAAQVIEHEGKYYFYYTTEGNSSVGGGKCIGVAVADDPTGPFVDIGKPLVRNIDTQAARLANGSSVPAAHTWEDIDPTAWVEWDEEEGDYRRVLCWGNNRFFNCELNEDMISIKDRDGNPNSISLGEGTDYDIAIGFIDGVTGREAKWTDEDGVQHFFTEAPYYFRQQDEDGEYYGPYYMFFATDWREQMAYATADTYEDFVNNKWDFGRVIMKATSTANTNHMAVFTFEDQPYFVYHNGTLPHGSGYRRVACVEELNINEDGSIDLFTETSTGIAGVTTTIQDSEGAYVAHEHFINTISDSDYPMAGNLVKDMLINAEPEEDDALWELELGKADPDNGAYVSIQSYNKPGLYITTEGTKVVLSQDWDDNTASREKATFRTLEGFAGYGVTFESIYNPGYYLISDNGDLKLSANPTAEECTFDVTTDSEITDLKVQKTKRMYTVGSELDVDDIRIKVDYENGDSKYAAFFTTNADEIDMSTVGTKTLEVTYTEKDVVKTEEIAIRVVEPGAVKEVYPVPDALNVENDQLKAAPTKTFSFEEDLDGSTLQVVGGSGAEDYTGDAVYADGHAGKAIQLGSYGLKLNVGNVGDAFTISMWMKPSARLTKQSSLIYTGSTSKNPEFWSSLAGGETYPDTLHYWSNGNGFGWAESFNNISYELDQWSLITLTQDGTDAALYINGAQVATGSAAASLAVAGSDVYIGINHWDALYNGLVDEIQVYNTALSETEVFALYDTRDAETVFAEKGFSVNESISLYTGKSSAVKVTLPAGVTADDAAVSYESKDKAIAAVDASGIVSGVKAGETVITTTVKVGNTTKTQDTTVTVKDASELAEFPLVVDYQMSSGTGDVITDASGNGNDATIVNPNGVSYVKDGDRDVLSINNTSSYINLPMGIYDDLTNKEEFTIEATYSRAANSGSAAWLFCIGSVARGTGTNYLFFSPNFSGDLRGGIKDSSETLINFNRTLPAEQYFTITYVVNNGRVSVYCDGIKIANDAVTTKKMATIVANGTQNDILGWIGKSCWSADPNLLGKIDSFRVFDKALTEAEVQVSNPAFNETLAENLKAVLTEETILGNNTSMDEIRYDMNLVDDMDGVDIIWTSSDPSVISADGSVNSPAKDTKVTLTAIAQYGQLEAKLTFDVTVKPMDLSRLEAILAEAKALSEENFVEGFEELQAVLEKIGDVSDVKTQQEAYDIEQTIKAAVSGLVYADAYKYPWDAIEAAAPAEDAALDAGEEKVLFTLPEEVANAVEVSYVSDNEDVATYADGKVTAVTDGTAVLTLTVKAKYDGWTMEYGTYVTVGDAVAPKPSLPYVDVSVENWFYDAVAYTYYENVMTGMDPEHFDPYGQLSRAQFALILYRIQGEPKVETTKSFADISGDEWYGQAVLWAAEAGVVNGYENGCFGPVDNITREQMAVMMFRYAKHLGEDTSGRSDYSTFEDAASVSEFAADAMGWVVEKGIITGKDNGTKLDPQGLTARCEAAAIIERFMK